MNTAATTPRSHASRYLFLFLLGLVIGAIGTVMAMRAIDARKDHFHDAIMHVQAWHTGQLKAGLCERRASRRHRTHTHDPRLHANRYGRDDPRQRFRAKGL